MSPAFRRRFRHHRGAVIVALPKEESEALREFLAQLRKMMIDDADPALRRLKPPARPDDEESEIEYREMIDDDLLKGRLEAIDIVESGIDGTKLDEEGVAAWMQSLNCLRLVLGERLEVEGIDTESLDDSTPLVGLYHWLAWLLEQLVEAAMPGLDTDD